MLVQKSTTIVMGQGSGATFPVHCNAVLDSEVPSISESLEKTDFYKVKYWSNIYEDTTFTSKTMTLPLPVTALATKRDQTLRIHLKNDLGQSLFLSFEVPILKTGDTSDIDTLVNSFNSQTIGSFGTVVEVSWVLNK